MEETEARTCGATRRNGEPCGAAPMKGQERCWRHGGKSPQAMRAAERRQVEERARKRLAGLDIEPIGDPVQALLDFVAEARAFKDQLAPQDREGWDAATIDAYGRAMRDAGKLLVDVNRLGLEDRLVRIEELKVRSVVDALRGVVRDLGHDPDEPQVRAAVRRHFTKLGGAEPEPAPVAADDADVMAAAERALLGAGDDPSATLVPAEQALAALREALRSRADA